MNKSTRIIVYISILIVLLVTINIKINAQPGTTTTSPYAERVRPFTSNPSPCIDTRFWFNSTADTLNYCKAGVVKSFIVGGGISGSGLTTNRITKWDGSNLVNSLFTDDSNTVNIGTGFNGWGILNIGRSVTTLPAPRAGIEVLMTGAPVAGITNAIIGQQTGVDFTGTQSSTRDLIAHQMQSTMNSTGAVRNIESIAAFTYNATSPTVNFITAVSSFAESDTGTVQEMHGLWHQNGIFGGTVGKAYGAKLVAPSVSGATVNENYGLWVGDHSAAGTINYNIYSAGANSKNYFEGGISMGCTVTATGTTGNQTINKPCGTVNIAAAGTSITITSNKVTANSIIDVTARTNDATCRVANYVAAAGSFVINMTAACTAETSVGFIIVNQ